MRLDSSIKEIKGIGDKTADLFRKINIETVRDLISYFPRTYIQFPEIKHPEEVVEGETAAVLGQIRQTPVVKRASVLQSAKRIVESACVKGRACGARGRVFIP